MGSKSTCHGAWECSDPERLASIRAQIAVSGSNLEDAYADRAWLVAELDRLGTRFSDGVSKISELHKLIGEYGTSLRDSSEALMAAIARCEEQRSEIGDLTHKLTMARSEVRDGSPIPGGWKLVPIVPTEEMLSVGLTAYQNAFGSPLTRVSFEWSAMLDAAPAKNPRPETDEERNQRMQREYQQTGMMRSADVYAVLGDPSVGVGSPVTEHIQEDK